MAGASGRRNTPESRLRNGAELRNCEQCGVEFWVARWQRERVKNGGRFCSRPCKFAAMRGVVFYRPPRKGDVIPRRDGYLLQWAPDHPKAMSGRVLQHVLVAEAKLGRYLEPDEEVHHINQRRDDNRPENLEILRNGEHQRMHAALPGVRQRMSDATRRHPRQRDPVTGRFLPNQ